MARVKWLLALLTVAAWSCGTGGEIDMGHRSGEVLFEDSLDGTPRDGWRVPPDRFVDHPEFGTVYLLEPGDGSTIENPPWVGDETWKNYRIEFEVCTTGETDGWVGPDFHVSDDGSNCCNLQFYSTRERDEVVFEAAGRWGRGSLGWKLFPMGQRFVRLPKGEWARIRVDVAGTFMNVTVNDDPESCYTVRYLPFSMGGVRLWNYYGSAYMRNLRITTLGENEVEPELEDPWVAVAGKAIVGGWQVSRVLPEGTGKEGAPPPMVLADAAWRDVEADPRGVVIVSALGSEYTSGKCVVFARAAIESPEAVVRAGRLTYSDQLTMWVNGREIFRGEPRGWFDPGRSPEDWFGRLMPDQFELTLPLEPGENEILIRLEVNEPLFGSGFWLRTE